MSDTTRAPRDWAIAPYAPGDEAKILEMFNTEFGRSRSIEHWRWKFGTNPYGGPFITLAWRTADQHLVGNHVLMPFPLNVLGRQVLAGHSLDLVVRPSHWGQGIFEVAGKDSIERLHAQGGRAVVAFPNVSSYPGFVRSLGWNRILFPELWTLRLDLGRAIERKLELGPLAALAGLPSRIARGASLAAQLGGLAHGPVGALAFRSDAALPADTDALWNAIRSQEVISLWKDARYLDWRYVRNPDHRFRFESLAGEDGTAALAVTVEKDDAVMICELLVRGRSVPVGRRLVLEIARRALGARARALQFFGHDAGYFAEVFAGFERRTAFENVFVGRSLAADDLDQRLANPHNWTLTYGDADFV